MSEKKEPLKVQMSLTTNLKGLFSFALLIGGACGVLFSTNPSTVMVSGLCLVYSYMLGLDARLSRHEEIMEAILKPKEASESNG